MGIFYLSGLGRSPGGATVPLQYIYLIMKAAENNNQNALRFFSKSGEQRFENVEYPETIIIFTSKEIIKGDVKNFDNLIDLWYTLPLNKIPSVPKTIIKSLNKCVKECNFKNIGSPWIKHFYFLEVDYKDFKDCYEKIYITMKGLSAKEVWINLIGGSNQITLSLFLASCLTGIPTKFIYLVQNEKMIHPDIQKPNFENPKIQIPPQNWYELPFFWLGILNDILKNIETECFMGKKTANIKQIKDVLTRSGLSSQFISKLKTANLIEFDANDSTKIYKGPGFEAIKKHEIETDVKNLSDWKQWAKNKKILYNIDFNQNLNLNKVL